MNARTPAARPLPVRKGGTRHSWPCRLALVALVSSALPAAPHPASAQRVPRRPHLEAGADTNSAYTYYQFGMTIIRKDPLHAADAFYWAARIDPTWAQPLYARRIALLLSTDPPFLVGYLEGEKSFTHSKKAARIDSLELRARMLAPFLHRELDMDLLRRYLDAKFESVQLAGGRRIDPSASSEFRFQVETYLRSEAPPWLRAMLASSERRFADALKYYQQSLSDDDLDAAEIHLARGRIFFIIGNDDSARVEIGLALDNLRERDAKDFVYWYESKGVLEQGLGLINERQGRLGQAREAYAQALEEDLSYYPAHVRLALLALAGGDTTTAVSELDLAAQIKEDDPWVQTTYGAVLAQIGRLAEAERHFHRVVELDPVYATPYYALGRVAELENRPADAVRDYDAYLARAPVREQSDRIAEVKSRLAGLATSTGPQQ